MDNDVPKLNTGTISGLMVTFNVAAGAQKPKVGVNVYMPEAWLSTTAGVHTPVIPLFDVVGNNGTVLPEHAETVEPKSKVGTIFGFMVTERVVGTAH